MRADDQAPKYKIKEIVRFISTTASTTYGRTTTSTTTQFLCTYLKENIYGFFSCTDICKLFLSPTTQKNILFKNEMQKLYTAFENLW